MTLAFTVTTSNRLFFFVLKTASESATNASDGAENASISSESNVYSVFGGEFVASKGGKPLDRERWVSCVIL